MVRAEGRGASDDCGARVTNEEMSERWDAEDGALCGAREGRMPLEEDWR